MDIAIKNSGLSKTAIITRKGRTIKMPRNKKEIGEKYNSIFAVRLRGLMDSNRVTQSEIADKIGKSRQTVSQYAIGTSEPSYETLVMIAKLFHTTTDYLLGLTDVKSPDTRIQSICEYTGLSEGSVEYLHKKSIPLSDQEVYDQVSDWLKTDAEYIYYVKSPSIHLSLYQTFGGSNFKFLYNPTLMREKYGTDDPVKVAKAQEVERCIEYRSHVEHSIRSRDRSTLSAVNTLLENDQETKVLEDIGQFFENALGKSMIMPSDKDGNSRFYDRITDRDLLLTLEALSNQIIRKIYSLRERIEKNSANKHE